MRRLIRTLIQGYRWFISPVLPRQCRYYPSCSAYALQAYEAYPLGKATMLSVRRICRCHPWHAGGYDPLPEPVQDLDRSRADEHPTGTPT